MPRLSSLLLITITLAPFLALAFPRVWLGASVLAWACFSKRPKGRSTKGR